MNKMEERTSTSLKRLSSNDSNNSNDDDNSNKSSSSSLLFSIPEVQISNIFSFLVLNDFLRLVLVSKDMKIILLKCVHHLCTMPEEIVLYPSHFVSHHHDQHHHNSILSNTNHHDNDHDPTINHPSSSIILQQPPQPQNLERTKRSTNIKNNKKKRKLNLSLHQLQHIVQRFHNIRYLSLYGLSDLGDSFLSIINDCPAASNLVSIELHGCRIIIHKQQQQQQHRYHQLNLRQNKNRLRHVSITGTIFAPYTTFLDSFVSSTSIHYLEFSGCHNLHDDDVLSIFKHTSTTLKELHLSNNCNLIHPTIHSDVLSTLDFKQCQNLQSLPSLHCPNLCHLNLSFCTTLEDVALHQILSSTSSCSLLTLYLKGCKQIKQPIFTSPRCQQLQILDVSLCSQITQMEISCPHLLSLKVRYLLAKTKQKKLAFSSFLLFVRIS